MIWLDIISSITTGRASYLLSQHPGIMASNVQTKLEHIMGCRDWVMLQIGRISALHEHKTQALQQEQFGCTGFEQTVEDISREFPCDLTRWPWKVSISQNSILLHQSTSYQTHQPSSHICLLIWHSSTSTWSLVVSKS